MVGFSLKKKDSKPNGFSGFSLKKANDKLPIQSKKSAFGTTNEEDDDVKEVKIDTFDAESGAYDKETGPEKPKGPIVISNAGNDDWRKISKERFNPQQVINNEESNQKLEYGINFIESNSIRYSKGLSIKKESDNFKEDVAKRPDVATLEEYEEVPVEDFGAAMLRGMGWKEENSKPGETHKVIQRGQYLGIGAKEIPGSNPNDKFYNPVKKIERNRSRSPDRDNNYRTRS